MDTPPAAEFHAFGSSHLGVLAFTGLVAAILIRRARRFPERVRVQNAILAAIMLALYPVMLLTARAQGWLTMETALPCQLCDVTAAVGAVALLTRRQRWAEIAWFWGLAGTLNGLLTPNLTDDFPQPGFFLFFGLHCAVVTTALYLVFGLRMKPQPGSVWRAFGWAQLYLASAGLVNVLAGTNYGFLRAKPAQPSLLDFLGPWPWYILALEGLALGFFGLLYLPFPRRGVRS